LKRRGEFELIADVFRPLTEGDPLAFGLGDDAALLRVGLGDDVVVTSDAMADGVHFTSDTPAAEVGRKLLRANLSDLAAMGAEPTVYTLTAVLPAGLPDGWIEEFAQGLREDQSRFRVHLVGGDTISAAHLVLSMTLLGRVERDRELRRNGARPGDAVYVSGTIGDAGFGLRVSRGELPDLGPEPRAFFLERLHRPSPRLKLGRGLSLLAHAAIDVSDGLLADLGHICSESGVAAEVCLGAVPVSVSARAAMRDDVSLGVAYLSAGDDYEILFTAPERAAPDVATLAAQLGIRVTRIGGVYEGAGVRLLDDAGNEIPVALRGFEHFRLPPGLRSQTAPVQASSLNNAQNYHHGGADSPLGPRPGRRRVRDRKLRGVE